MLLLIMIVCKIKILLIIMRIILLIRLKSLNELVEI